MKKGVKYERTNRDIWDKYLNPYDNLLYAILIQAVKDKDGYFDDTQKAWIDKSEPNEFLYSESARTIYDYLKTAPLNGARLKSEVEEQ